MKTAIYSGSFDPITNGHLDMIKRAAQLFDRVIVCVLVNHEKKPMFTVSERTEFIRRVTSDIPNVEVAFFDGLLADFARKQSAFYVIKGLRNMLDYEQETLMAAYNHKLNPDLETVFFTARQEYQYLSSSAVKELGRFGADLSEYLPQQIISDFNARMKEHI